MFEESNIIARTGRIEDETKYLYQYRQNGYYKNIEREGNRGRSATLLVPDVNISLFFTGIGLLYNANDSTIRHFMPHDFWTDNARRTEDFFNMRLDNKKFVQTHSKEKFLKTYKNFLKDNPQKDYNEIIAKGANELGTIHTIIGKELKEAAKDISTGKFIYNGIELDLELVAKKTKRN